MSSRPYLQEVLPKQMPRLTCLRASGVKGFQTPAGVVEEDLREASRNEGAAEAEDWSFLVASQIW